VRILHLTDLFSPSQGGMESHILSLVQERVRRGHDISVVTLSPAANHSDGRNDDSTEYRVHRISGGFTRVSGAYSDAQKPYHPPVPDPIVARRIREIVDAEVPDVVHAHNWMVFSYLAVKSKSSPPVLMMLHDYGAACPKKTAMFTPADVPCSGPSPWKCQSCAASQYGRAKASAIVAGLRLSNATLLRRVDAYAANSEAVANFVRPFTHLTPINVVSSFATNDAFAEHPVRPDWLPRGDYIFYAGALGEHKGIGDLLSAYERLASPAPPLVIAGLPKPDMPTHWPRGTEVHHDVPHAEVLAAWRYCLFGVVPSRWPEPFGMVAIEAAAAGKAVVATKVGGLGEVVLDEITGLTVAPRNPNALAEAMTRLLEDPVLCATLGSAAKTHAGQFRLSAVADRLDELCESLCRTSR
jgi:glycosyltransferase involved in cell wall biosynthesis